MPKKISALLAALLLVSRILPVVSAAAPVAYMPGVTEEMTRAAYWTAGLDETDKVLAVSAVTAILSWALGKLVRLALKGGRKP